MSVVGRGRFLLLRGMDGGHTASRGMVSAASCLTVREFAGHGGFWYGQQRVGHVKGVRHRGAANSRRSQLFVACSCWAARECALPVRAALCCFFVAAVPAAAGSASCLGRSLAACECAQRGSAYLPLESQRPVFAARSPPCMLVEAPCPAPASPLQHGQPEAPVRHNVQQQPLGGDA